MIHKSGFIDIIGDPNVGKSTLINSLVGEKISIITDKPQTTRKKVLGIINKPNYQMIFSDTPGIIHKPVYLMQKMMMIDIKKSLNSADIILIITEIGKYKYISKDFFDCITNKNIPIIVLINKIDKIGIKYKENVLYNTIYYCNKLFPDLEILPISALKNINKDFLMKKIESLLPEHPPFYPKKYISNRPKRFFVNEMIRENIYILYDKEIPYSTEVVTDFFKEKQNIINIRSSIYVEKESQKGILIGKKGNILNKLKLMSIKNIEHFYEKKIRLLFHVKVSKNFRYNFSKLKHFGY
ncbi:GTPase Era [Blattabacterium cuenoti]|uniref:GTPase Era n=1 Tax=Blattabacterium cuenoti TaxID=1653831 RepID=UPI00163D3B79|nr:GTPase Era [Blattabacterium cuenoti]